MHPAPPPSCLPSGTLSPRQTHTGPVSTCAPSTHGSGGAQGARRAHTALGAHAHPFSMPGVSLCWHLGSCSGPHTRSVPVAEMQSSSYSISSGLSPTRHCSDSGSRHRAPPAVLPNPSADPPLSALGPCWDPRRRAGSLSPQRPASGLCVPSVPSSTASCKRLLLRSSLT